MAIPLSIILLLSATASTREIRTKRKPFMNRFLLSSSLFTLRNLSRSPRVGNQLYMASRASRRGPRLPEYLQTRILDFYFAFVADAGGAAVLSKHGRIAPLRLVNKHFKWVAGHQFFNIYWLYDFGFDNSIEAEQLRMMDHNVVKGLERITCPCRVRGSLELRITELDGNKGLEGRSRAVKDMVERVLKVYHRAVEFQLVMTRTTSPLIEVVWRFPRTFLSFCHSRCPLTT